MNWLTFLRLQRGWTQRELADRLSINPSLLCKVERGWFTRSPGDLETKLKAVFGDRWPFRALMERVPDLTEMKEKHG